MKPLQIARQHLNKAREFLDAVDVSLDLDMFNAATSNAVVSGINSKDAICLRLTGRTRKNPDYAAPTTTSRIRRLNASSFARPHTDLDSSS